MIFRFWGFPFLLLNSMAWIATAQGFLLPEEDGINKRELIASSTCDLTNHHPSLRVNTTERLTALRLIMNQFHLDAYIIPMDDDHQDEYVAPEDDKIKYISGFTGSAGTAIVTHNKAALWTDGRYFLQAAAQLDCNWTLMKSKMPGVPSETEWLANVLNAGEVVGLSSKNVMEQQWKVWDEELKDKSIQLKGLTENLVDQIWTDRLQSRISEPGLTILNTSISGMDWQQKVRIIRGLLTNKSADALLVTALDNIAWLFNLRGSDIPYNPVFKAYTVISQDFIRLFVRNSVITEEVKEHLKSEGCSGELCVQIRAYDQLEDTIREYLAFWNKVWVAPSTSHYVHSLISKDKLLTLENPIELLQSVKNSAEIQGLKAAHIRDAVALIDFMSLLEEEVKNGKYWDELKVSTTLTQFRNEQARYRGDSFPAISAFASNGAIIHYRPENETNKIITTTEMFLLDSGGQYLDGTTDVTRTFHFGQPTPFQKEAYTRVLKGAINVLQLIFASGYSDAEVDILARVPLMQVGLNYLHGTGHGIGSYLNVHEGPITIRPLRMSPSYRRPVVLLKGMFISDEPGYYHEGEFGVRLETIMTVVEAHTKYKFNNSTYLTFEAVTLVPFEPHLIEVELLTRSELEWLNEYHAKVEKIVGEELKNQNRLRGYQWMTARTRSILNPQLQNAAFLLSSLTPSLIFGLLYVIFITLHHI